jgi:hypothetical protein
MFNIGLTGCLIWEGALAGQGSPALCPIFVETPLSPSRRCGCPDTMAPLSQNSGLALSGHSRAYSRIWESAVHPLSLDCSWDLTRLGMTVPG